MAFNTPAVVGLIVSVLLTLIGWELTFGFARYRRDIEKVWLSYRDEWGKAFPDHYSTPSQS
jgi:hypothetical protein